MKTGHVLSIFLMALISALPLFAADRLTDQGLKELVARIEDGRDRFDNGLDDQLKNSILRSPSGEVDVKRYLNDFKDGDPSSAETTGLLARATKLQTILNGHQAPSSAKVWTGITPRLQTVAGAYGVSWPSR